jgi:hypothetical protein
MLVTQLFSQALGSYDTAKASTQYQYFCHLLPTFSGCLNSLAVLIFSPG